MNSFKRAIAALELLLIFPAGLFMTALVARQLQFEPAHTAQQIVLWYAVRPWTLWVLLIALPFAALVTGCATLLCSWKDDVEMRQTVQHPLTETPGRKATLFVAAVTLTAGVFLAVAVVHMLMN